MLFLRTWAIRLIHAIRHMLGLSASAKLTREFASFPDRRPGRRDDDRADAAMIAVNVSASPWSRLLFWVTVIALVLAVAAVPLARWDAARKRDQWWISELKTKRLAVQTLITDANIDVDAADAAAIAALDAEIADAMMTNNIRKTLDAPISDACTRCRIPIVRVRRVQQ
jgi:hypothetical protein